MNIFKNNLLSLGLCASFFWLSNMAYSAENGICEANLSQLTLSSNVEHSGGNRYLIFDLHNSSPSEITIFRANLGRAKLVLLLVTDTGALIKEELFPDDLSAGVWEIAPNETISTKLVLDVRFPDLDKIISNQEIILFWSTLIEPVNSECSKRFAGYSIIK